MFYEFVKSKLEMGTIKVRPPAKGTDDKTKIEAKGLTAVAAMFLSRKEKEQLETLSKYIAMRSVKVRYYDSGY